MTNIMSELARKLRREKTQAERVFWRELRELNRQQGFHFRQQAPVGPYIADFADHTAKLVIELDGGQHGEPGHIERDASRSKWLAANGYRVLRFWNGDVLNNRRGVVTVVLQTLGILAGQEGAA